MTSENNRRPSILSAFFGGGMSGFASGVVMSLVIAAVAPALATVGLAAAGTTFFSMLTGTGPLMIAAATLFGGIMSAKRAMFDAPHGPHHAPADTIVPVPMMMASGPALAPVMSYADAPEQASSKSWVAETGRAGDTPNRIQQILADGSMSDKDRASAILANRDAANQEAARA